MCVCICAVYASWIQKSAKIEWHVNGMLEIDDVKSCDVLLHHLQDIFLYSQKVSLYRKGVSLYISIFYILHISFLYISFYSILFYIFSSFLSLISFLFSFSVFYIFLLSFVLSYFSFSLRRLSRFRSSAVAAAAEDFAPFVSASDQKRPLGGRESPTKSSQRCQMTKCLLFVLSQTQDLLGQISDFVFVPFLFSKMRTWRKIRKTQSTWQLRKANPVLLEFDANLDRLHASYWLNAEHPWENKLI